MKLIYGIKDKPRFSQLIVFAFQQLLAIMAATLVVPVITNNNANLTGDNAMSTAAALFGAGIGTLIYVLFTQAKSPVFLGSSFAFLGSMAAAFAGAVSAHRRADGGDHRGGHAHHGNDAHLQPDYLPGAHVHAGVLPLPGGGDLLGDRVHRLSDRRNHAVLRAVPARRRGHRGGQPRRVSDLQPDRRAAEVKLRKINVGSPCIRAATVV